MMKGVVVLKLDQQLNLVWAQYLGSFIYTTPKYSDKLYSLPDRRVAISGRDAIYILNNQTGSVDSMFHISGHTTTVGLITQEYAEDARIFFMTWNTSDYGLVVYDIDSSAATAEVYSLTSHVKFSYGRIDKYLQEPREIGAN